MSSKFDPLGDRMKNFYEDRCRYYLPRRTYTIIRLDMKCGHSYTKNLKKPWDEGFMEDMAKTAIYLCLNIQGVKLSFVQSDEISLVLTDFDDLQTEAWFDGNIQKIVSVAASLATAEFNQRRLCRYATEQHSKERCLIRCDLEHFQFANFDARVFTIPERMEVINHLVWRQQDSTRNSIQMLARAHFSHTQCQDKSCNELQDMLMLEKQINWNDLSSNKKRGSLVIKVPKAFEIPEGPESGDIVTRHIWEEVECPIFSQNRDFIKNIILSPTYE